MIKNKEYFSHKPLGMIWMCSECDHVHLRYGNITVTLDDSLVDDLLAKACRDDHAEEVCSGCDNVHLDCKLATLHIASHDFDQLLQAIYRFITKSPTQDEQKPKYEQVYNN